MQLNVYIQKIEDVYTNNKSVDLSILRLDKLHPIVSGNKYFKLKYFIKEAILKEKKAVATFGGYYSNHLHAAAYACRENGIKSIGYVKGHPPKVLNDTLKDCIKFGMELKFIPHHSFDQIQNELQKDISDDTLFIPMGGYDSRGMKGASEILDFEGVSAYDYIIAAAGTGTMAAGLLLKLNSLQKLVVFSSINNNESLKNEICFLDNALIEKKDQLDLQFDFHFGGYAKSNQSLFDTMNWFYDQHGIPTDFVYTGKMISGFYSLLQTGYFKSGSKILLIHSGGLQGNRSIEHGKLNFQ
ncbi:MAG: 1-aminocyclopropane-1-carboxylate deaminase/D-cysteine desulfhydrase [Chitinophagaceae bacterium]